MDKKDDLKIIMAETVTGSDDVRVTIVSTIQLTPDEKPITKTFRFSDSTDKITEETFRDLEKAGYKLNPKKFTILKESVDRGKQWGTGWKIGLHLTGFDFERTPTQETKTSMEMTYEIVKEED
jgi:hypothetical protein